MKGTLLASIASLALVGCSTTPNQMRQDAPHEAYTSEKSPKEIMICVANNWEDRSVVNTRERLDGYSVSATLSDGKLHYLADIEVENTIAITRLYKWRSVAIGRDPWFADAENCQ